MISNNATGAGTVYAGRMILPNKIKTSGYLISTVSVVLLGIVSWKSAQTSPLMATCLIGGMIASVAGMFLRWLSYQIDEE